MSLASNKISNKRSRLMFTSRKYYDSLTNLDSFGHIDLWKDKPLYGKVDRDFNIIYPNDAYVKPLFSEKNDLYTLNFVSDAFRDMRDFILKGKMKGKFDAFSRSFIHDIQPHSGMQNVNTLYNRYLKTSIQKIAKLILTRPTLGCEARTFDEFIKFFQEFSPILFGTGAVVTRSEFILRGFTPNSISGLMVEIDKNDYSSDPIKLKKYFADQYYLNYVNAAVDFGFKVDKNAPWRLVADLASPVWNKNAYLKRIMDSYGLSTPLILDNFFDLYYSKTYQTDIDDLKFYIWKTYDLICQIRPDFKVIRQKTDIRDQLTSNSIISYDTVHRRVLTLNDVHNKYDDLFWFQMYFQIRLKEMGIELPNKSLKSSLETISQKYRLNDYQTVLDYINEQLTGYLKNNVAFYMSRFRKELNLDIGAISISTFSNTSPIVTTY